MKVPNNPLLFPRPKLVECPKETCKGIWYWRTWWQGKYKTACSFCKSTVIPIEIPEGGIKGVRLIRCPYCGGLQWYVGDKEKTTCTSNGCGKRNIKVIEVSPSELHQIIQEHWDEFQPEDQQYYQDRLEEYK